MIKAIETPYAGCLFRSRLEARWAVFFDTLGIPWEYEVEGWETSVGRYLPDFRIQIPQVKRTGHYQWFEVKPDNAPKDNRHPAISADLGQPILVARGMPRDNLDQRKGTASPIRMYLGGDEYSVAFVDATCPYGDQYNGLGDNRIWMCEDFAESLYDAKCHLAVYAPPGSENFYGYPPVFCYNIDKAFTAARSERFGT